MIKKKDDLITFDHNIIYTMLSGPESINGMKNF